MVEITINGTSIYIFEQYEVQITVYHQGVIKTKTLEIATDEYDNFMFNKEGEDIVKTNKILCEVNEREYLLGLINGQIKQIAL
jgi:hypothetical protein